MQWDKGFIWDPGREPPKPPNRVVPHEGIIESMDRIPFLQQFCLGLIQNGFVIAPYISSVRVNEYLGRQAVDHGQAITSDFINQLLEEAEKRGDLE